MARADSRFANMGRDSFRALVLRSIVLPCIVMALLAVVLVAQITRLRAAAAEVEHSDDVLAALYRFKLEIIDMQSSVRGFLYTGGDVAFLEPYTTARPQVDATFEALRELTSDRPAAQRQVHEIRPLYQSYVALLDERVAAGRQGRFELTPDFKAVAPRIDDLRGRIRSLMAEETQLRVERNDRADREARLTTYLGVGVALLAGVVLAFLSRDQLRRLSESYERALTRARDLSDTLERRVEERTAEVTRANAKLAEANKELEAFSYSVSHDLRAPMRHITGFAKLLKMSARDKLSPDDVEHLDTIFDTAVFAGRLVDDLLAFSRVGRTQLKRVPVDMNGLVRRCMDDLTPETAGRQIEWSVADLPPATGDPALLQMVWLNLLANAVKYSAKASSARIEVGATRDDEGTTYFVRDNGVGFDMAYAHKLFGVFQRLHRAEEFEGTGIGLANVRRIILRHDGQVTAQGNIGAGATFSFRLPDLATATDGEHEAST